MSHIMFYLLGPPRIERDGRPVSVDTRKAVALFAYLAVSKQRHTRDALAALLWPEYDQTRARATLRRTLSALNKTLAGDWLDVDREAIGLAPGCNLWLDVDAFHDHLAECRRHGHPLGNTCPRCLHSLSEAASLYRDDFLAGFGLRGSDSFDEWQYFQSEGLRRELASALEQLVRCYIAAGDFALAIQHARRWLAVDHLHEPAHRQLMLLYAWSGQRAAALRQYRDCVQVLEQELGVAPLEATTQLYRTIKENQTTEWALDQGFPGVKSSPLRPSPVQDAKSRVQSDLVGRATEWAALLHAYSNISHRGHVLTLTGEAGIGKTRLAAEFLEHARTQGAVTAAARSYEGEANLAYEPVIALLRGLLDRSDSGHRIESVPVQWRGEAARLVPEIAAVGPGLSPVPALDSPGAQSRFFEGVRQVVRALCLGERPGVLFFDDLQWTDAASLDLLTYLVRRLDGWPLCLVLAWRRDEVSGQHRLHQMLAEAQRSGLTTQLPLSRLSRSHVKELVRSAVGAGEGTGAGAAYEDITERLYGETEGLPFFVVEYLAALETGSQPVGQDWALPGGVRDLLRSRLVTVSQTGKQLLNAASVIGRSFDFQTLYEASGRSEEETVSGLEELISLGLVVEVGLSQVAGGAGDHSLNYDFSHEKLRTLTYEETSLARRRLLHRRVAEALEARGRDSGEMSPAPGAIANHYILAGNEAAAARYFKLAGEQARSLYANAEALSHFRMSLALGHPDASELHAAIGDMHTLLAEYGEALSSYETAASLLDRELSKGETLAGLEYKLGGVYQRRGEWDLAASHYESALRVLGEAGSPGARARIYADWSLTAHHSRSKRSPGGNSPQELARRALELAQHEEGTRQDKRALAQAHNILGILASSNNDADLARYHLEQSLALAESLNDPGRRAAALNNLALALGAAGDSGHAIELAGTALQLCISQGDRHREAALHNNLADLLHGSGRQVEAIAHLKQAVAIYAEIGVEAGDVQPAIWKLAEW